MLCAFKTYVPTLQIGSASCDGLWTRSNVVKDQRILHLGIAAPPCKSIQNINTLVPFYVHNGISEILQNRYI